MPKKNWNMIAIAVIVLGLIYYFMKDSGCTHCNKGSEVSRSVDVQETPQEFAEAVTEDAELVAQTEDLVE